MADPRGYILLTYIEGKYNLMVIDHEGFETLEFDNFQEAKEAKRAWEDFLYED
jgi:hypothetical protein